MKDGWEVELWVIDDQPVTLKKITLSLVLLVLGLIASRRLTHLLRKKLLSQTHLDESARDATEKGVWYLLVLLVSLASLTIVNIPLTAFTFLGGALAIGVGFGAQNLMNNFISGFIMMFERPIKIGDLIEIDGNFGVIEEIGARCTRVRTLANVHILVPNSTFLEKNITNWTLSSHEVRCGVDIGVAYGTPSRKVEEVLLRVAMKTDRVQAEPKPLVLFQDFGDSSLAFSLYVSIAVKDLIDRRQIESNLRHAIDQAFKEAGLVIAFPQLDVHLIDPRST
ncbi:MAG: hypothetical protein A2508_02900 [Candidatus Lambdaproteobacteria bacterium RIFOXYD12_FULL_49_8]|uniref:Mechanosensitive ion channel protein n=1 Tax=Candidatus Lambdaproteobacteria bacterium RIFOXYD2_FULL_50_16 TaxID=1817772 RepID=A0A1F6GDM3_9PROT|nr:MAG: hypothetical protein A2527_04650 [Candidatus Lambdaproteobacteria bacterium RIFOXYD2_FULL_50_16]OGG98127.1 MAG: hypothetical protein A2508_02900 [Candidatus Lambdaproteobacteria bacterium RIFOXYD12_FULL_49_8]